MHGMHDPYQKHHTKLSRLILLVGLLRGHEPFS